MVADYTTPNHRKWTGATIIKKLGNNTYLCRLRDERIWKRHTNQIIRVGTSVASGDGRGERDNMAKLTKTFYPASSQGQPRTASADQTIINFQVPPETTAPMSSSALAIDNNLTSNNIANSTSNTLLQHTNEGCLQPSNDHCSTHSRVLVKGNICNEGAVSAQGKTHIDSVVDGETSRFRGEYDDADRVERGNDKSLGNDAGDDREQSQKKVTGTKTRSRSVKLPIRFKDYVTEIE